MFLSWRICGKVCKAVPDKLSQVFHVSTRRLSSFPSTHVSSNSQDALAEMSQSLQLQLNFVSEKEEESLSAEIIPYFRRIRYQQDHWDSAIVGYRETEIRKWSQSGQLIIDRILERAGLKSADKLADVHVLDLDASGHIKPHVDSVRFCGDIIAGVSLLTDAIMRFVHNADPKKSCDVLLSRRSLYIMSGSSRYDYTHELLPSKALFKGVPIEKNRRIAIICRNKPRS